MRLNSRIFVAGHRGLVGSAICRRLTLAGYANLILSGHDELELLDQAQTQRFFFRAQPDYVFLAAAKVGGIAANSAQPGQFLYENLAIQTNVIEAARITGVQKLLFLGSSCIYPRDCPQPIREEYLLTGPLEPTNAPYAIAKIAGIKMCQAYREQYGFRSICLMPTNLYGPRDNFDPETSHVLPALIRKFHEAKETGAREVTLWGSGKPRREFLHVDDLADAALFLMRNYDSAGILNVGVGTDLTIREVAEMIAKIVSWGGRIRFDASRPDGTPRKLLDLTRIQATGWKASIGLREGIESTYRWYLASGLASAESEPQFQSR